MNTTLKASFQSDIIHLVLPIGQCRIPWLQVSQGEISCDPIERLRPSLVIDDHILVHSPVGCAVRVS